MKIKLDISAVDGECLDSIRALVRAAYLFRGMFVLAAGGRLGEGMLLEKAEALELTEAVIDRWVDHLGLDVP